MPPVPVSIPPPRLSSRWPEARLAGFITVVYILYLLTSPYQHLYYDAELYWQLGHRFYEQGRFNLLAYDDALRGYSYPLLNFACLALRKALHLEAVTVVKLVNAGLAGLLFGVVGPRLWQVATGAARLPSLGRRLLWAGLSFVFWRDYFNFSLSDFPALVAFGRGSGWTMAGRRWLVTGAAYGLFLGGCFMLSAHILQTVEPRFRLFLLPQSVPTTADSGSK